MKRRKVNPQDCTPMEKQRIIMWMDVVLEPNLANATFEIRELNGQQYEIWYYLRHPNGDWMYYDKENNRRVSTSVIVTTDIRFPWPGKASSGRDSLVL